VTFQGHAPNEGFQNAIAEHFVISTANNLVPNTPHLWICG